MGAAASLPNHTSAKLTRALCDEYEILRLKKDMNDEEINIALTAKYNALIDEYYHNTNEKGWDSVSDNGLSNRISRVPSKQVLSRKQEEELVIPKLDSHSKLPDPSLSPPRRTAAARRKSFASVRLPAIEESKVPPSPINYSTAGVSIPQGVDSWDSVTQQPFCHVCMMAFKSIFALEKHEKFSSIHEKVAKKKLDDYEKSLISEEPYIVEQVEGVHFKMLYAGRKLFWRTQDQVDFCFYHHFATDALEVVALDGRTEDSTVEVNRLYLKYSILMEMVTDLFSRKEFDENELKIIATQTPQEKEESLRLSLITFVLSRLAVVDDTMSLYSDGNKVTFKLSPSDSANMKPLLHDIPEQLAPVHVVARRRSSTIEIESAIQNLSLDTDAITKTTDAALAYLEKTTEALDAASNISTIITGAVEELTTRTRFTNTMSPREKWQWAFGRVKHNIKTEENKAILAAKYHST
jgi:hypothetical protein